MVYSSLAMGKLKDALNAAREAISSIPKSSTVYLLMGNVLSKSAHGATEAVKAYSKAVKLNPFNRTAAIIMAETLVEQGKFEDAIQWYKLLSIFLMFFINGFFYKSLSAILKKYSCPKIRLQLAKVVIVVLI
jgi:tetratricopeptide (TPR) repeat protein